MAYSHIAHNCQIGNKVVIVNYAGLSGYVCVEDGAFISGLAGIHQFVKIGTLAIIGGHSKITKDVLPYVMAEGNPAELKGLHEDYIMPTMNDWKVFSQEATAVGMKAIKQGIARVTMTKDELFAKASKIIKRSRNETKILMDKGIIPKSK